MKTRLKNCIICDKEIYGKSETKLKWEKRKFCSIKYKKRIKKSKKIRKKISETNKRNGIGK